MTDIRMQVEDPGKTIDTQTVEKQGEAWIQAIVDQDFQHLTAICLPEVKSTLLLPKRIGQLESSADLAKQVEDWFGEYNFIQKEQSRVAMVGQKLGIFYRLNCKEIDASFTIEQQVYCTIRDGRIEQLKLICSGFQPDQVLADDPSMVRGFTNAGFTPILDRPAIQADALLEFTANAAQGSTCALLTPYIKGKLREMASGQVLEVHVDDVTAKEDIAAWCRLSGNSLLKMEQVAGQGLVYYIQKK